MPPCLVRSRHIITFKTQGLGDSPMLKIISVAILFVSSMSFARPQYYGLLLSEYPHARIENTFKCQTCHDGRAMNLFGKAFSSEFLRLSKPEIFKKIGPLDSDGDGISNEQEIMEGRNPGVAGK